MQLHLADTHQPGYMLCVPYLLRYTVQYAAITTVVNRFTAFSVC